MSKHIIKCLAIFGLIVSCVLSVATHANEQLSVANVEGRWEGALDTGQAKLRLLLDVSKAADGSLVGTLTSVDQGGVRIPIARLEVNGSSLRLDVSAVSGNFEGAISEDKLHITGTWTQGISLPLEFIRTSVAK